MNTIRRAIAALLPSAVLSSGSARSGATSSLVSSKLILCIPGKWVDRSDFIRQVITLEPKGRYMFAGMVLADTVEKDHVPLDFSEADAAAFKAFEIAGQGKLPLDVLRAIQNHRSVLYLHFPANLFAERQRVLKFSRIVQAIGGIAIKVESSGVAHTWGRWNELVAGSQFDQYVAAVTLIGDSDYYYSCGMHNFGLADCEAPTTLGLTEAADLMNRFNFWRLSESPILRDGHTFSIAPDSQHFRLRAVRDTRHGQSEPFFNPSGLWQLHGV